MNADAFPEGPGPLATGSTLTLHYWSASTGTRAVFTFPIGGGPEAGSIAIAGPCLLPG
jgi:hypothetical protein